VLEGKIGQMLALREEGGGAENQQRLDMLLGGHPDRLVEIARDVANLQRDHLELQG